jgi:hypothetical protein
MRMAPPTAEASEKRRLPFLVSKHQNVMRANPHSSEFQLRIPSEPEPFPIHEPPDPPENPDVPVREPDPDDPGQI